MSDKMTPEQRHLCMSHVRSKNTKPELLVRKYLFANGFRYRIHVKSLPGKPDIVLPKYRTVVFVDGCFWHGHEECASYSFPKSNVNFWREKIDRNRKRDHDEVITLRRMGWHVIRIWECQLKPKVRTTTLKSLSYTLHYIFLMECRAKMTVETYKERSLETNTAAEGNFEYEEKSQDWERSAPCKKT